MILISNILSIKLYLGKQTQSLMKFLTLTIIVILFLFHNPVFSQEGGNDGGWDNQMYFGNKVGWGGGKWRQTAEFQTRYKDDVGELEQWHLEYVASYLPSKNFEIVPDFRITRKPGRVDYRPGFGVIYKSLWARSQLVHQVKWQYDIKTGGLNDSQGLRYAIFYNYVFSEKWVGSMVAGTLYEYGDDFTGVLGFRGGPNVSYIINKQHSLSVGYFYGLLNTKVEPTTWTNVGIFSVQLIINIRKDYEYLPAKYINF